MTQHFAPTPPFGVQDIFFSTYQRHCSSTNLDISAFMHMQQAICYLVGFGVDRNMDQVYTHLAIAADSQYPAIRPLLVRIRQAFDLDHTERPLPPLADPMAAQNVSILMEAIKQTIYSSPLYEIGQVWKTTQVEEPDVGSELHRAAYLGVWIHGAHACLYRWLVTHRPPFAREWKQSPPEGSRWIYRLAYARYVFFGRRCPRCFIVPQAF